MTTKRFALGLALACALAALAAPAIEASDKTTGQMSVSGPAALKAQAVYWWIAGSSISYDAMPERVAVYYLNGDVAAGQPGEYATTYLVIMNTAAAPATATVTLRSLAGVVQKTVNVELGAFATSFLDITEILLQ
jgi:hypothetical protein